MFEEAHKAIKKMVRQEVVRTKTARDIVRKAGFTFAGDVATPVVRILSVEGSRQATPEDCPCFDPLGRVYAGGTVSYAIGSGGQAYAWGGINSSNILGLSETDMVTFSLGVSSPTESANGITDIEDIAWTLSGAALLRSDGSVYITDIPSDPGLPDPHPFELLSGISGVVALTANNFAAPGAFYFLKPDGTVWTMGAWLPGIGPDVSVGEYYTSGGEQTSDVPIQMPTSKVSGVEEVVASELRIVYRKNDGTTAQWRNNVTNPQTISSPPANIVKMAQGAGHTVALTSSGDVYVAGANLSGQWGNGTASSDNYAAWHKTNGTDYTDISANGFNSFAIKDTELYSWGQGGSISGRGVSAAQVNVPTQITGGPIDGWTSLARVNSNGAGSVMMAIHEDSCVYIWGGNLSRGRLGQGHASEPSQIGSPTKLPIADCVGSPVPNPPWPT